MPAGKYNAVFCAVCVITARFQSSISQTESGDDDSAKSDHLRKGGSAV